MESLYLLSFAIAIDRYAVDNANLRFALWKALAQAKLALTACAVGQIKDLLLGGDLRGLSALALPTRN